MVEYAIMAVMLAGMIATRLSLYEAFARQSNLPKGAQLEIVSLKDQTTCSVLTSDANVLKQFITKAYHQAGLSH